MARSITVAAAQTGPVLTRDIAAHVGRAVELVEQAAGHGAEIICFPELFLTPFFPATLVQDYEDFFTSLPDPAIDPLFARCRQHGMALILPYAERSGRAFYNAALVVDGDGRTLGTYRKTHIPAILPSGLKGGTGSYEKFYFSPGHELPVFEVRGVRFGIQICYDRKFPEGCRALALDGAEIIFMPICAATYGETKLRGETWELPLQARAYENGVFVVAVNRAGNEHGRQHIGKSMIVNPVGAEIMALAKSDGDELLVTTLELDDVTRAQKSLPWWRDRRPDLYGRLVRE
jgi:predicted amidohydrolase